MQVIKKKSGHHPRRRGSVLVEFALISLLLYVILAATLEFGRAIFGAQVLQQAADTAARELARTPLPASTTIKLLIEDSPTDPTIPGNSVPSTIYSENWLVVSLSQVPAGMRLVDYFAQNAPVVNQQLLPLMVVTYIGGEQYLQYPGALTSSTTTPTGYTVTIPVVSYAGGVETIQYSVPVLQEILPGNPPPGTTPDPYSDPNQCPFSLTAGTTTEAQPGYVSVPAAQVGLAAVRINYPFQAATLSATQADGVWPPDPNFNYIDVPASEAGEDVAASTGPGAQTYAGPNGLGIQFAATQNVRPFRRLMSAQAIYRREVFAP